MAKHVCAEHVPIFNHLDYDSLIKITEIMQHKFYQKGEIIYSPDKKSGLFILAKGKIKIYQLSSNGKEQLLRVIEQGNVIGEETLFGTQNQNSYAEALTDIEVCAMNSSDFKNLLIQYPEISIKLLEEYSRRLALADQMATRTATESVGARIASYLIDLSKATSNNKLNLPLSMKELAAFLGTTPETVSRRIKQFEDAGILTHKGKHITILQLDELKNIS